MADSTNGAAFYELIVQGTPDSYWEDWFDGLSIIPLPDNQVRITGEMADQPALHGLLERIRDLNITLLLVRRL